MAGNPIEITDCMLDSFLRCERKGWFRHKRVPTSSSEYVQFVETQAKQYCADAVQALMASSSVIDMSAPSSFMRCLREGHPLIVNARIETNGNVCESATLEQVPGESQLGNFHYQPILFLPTKTIDVHHKMLLALRGLTLGDLQEQYPAHGTIIYGSEFRRSRIRIDSYLIRLEQVLQKFREILRNEIEPPVFLNSHCNVCEFFDRCRVDALNSDHLSLLRGMSATEISRNNKKGIFTVHQLSYTFRSRRPSKRSKPMPPPHSYALQALACREKKLFIHGDAVIPDATTSVYFDFEGLPDRRFCYLFGSLVCRNGTAEYLPHWADSEDQEATTFKSFLDSIPDPSVLRLFHYGDYEIRAMRRMKKKLPSSYSERITAMEERTVNVLHLIYHHFYFPVLHNSLKNVAASLDFQWSDLGANGLVSMMWRQIWEQTGDPDTKRRLLNYNRDDCIALRRVTEFLRDSLDNKENYREGVNLPLAVEETGSLRPSDRQLHRFGRFQSSIEALNEINKCAYFDYQQDMVFARSKETKRCRRISRKRKSPRTRPNKTVEVRVKRCIHCRNRNISERYPIRRRVVDLHFGKGLVKKWIMDYDTFRYNCKKCKTTFLPNGVPDNNTKYGHGLVSWCVYQHVVGGQNMLRVRRTLMDVFNLDIPHTAIWRFKKTVQELIKPFHQSNWSQMLDGPVLYVDETQVKLRGMKGYVWVFAGTQHVCYEYRESRESSFLHERLRDFAGVLVSDFFTGYDSLPIPQQKCLIHLIRDMNADLRAAPFDDEFRELVQRFAVWLQGVTQTVDLYGLKRRHLQKHKRAGCSLFDTISQQNFTSSTAQKYQSRIAKYGDRLLTFMDFDGVSWNNNAAEHAIKTFARFRRFADGRFTEVSVGELLSIMSVLQTLELQNIAVLPYLRGLGPANASRPPTPLPTRGFGSTPEEKSIVMRMVAMRRKDHEGKRTPYSEMAKTLNSEGVPTSRGGQWWGTTIRNAIRRHRCRRE